MSDRGPDSAGLAIYGKPTARKTKIMVQSQAPETDFKMLKKTSTDTFLEDLRKKNNTSSLSYIDIQKDSELNKYKSTWSKS